MADVWRCPLYRVQVPDEVSVGALKVLARLRTPASGGGVQRGDSVNDCQTITTIPPTKFTLSIKIGMSMGDRDVLLSWRG